MKKILDQILMINWASTLQRSVINQQKFIFYEVIELGLRGGYLETKNPFSRYRKWVDKIWVVLRYFYYFTLHHPLSYASITQFRFKGLRVSLSQQSLDCSPSDS